MAKVNKTEAQQLVVGPFTGGLVKDWPLKPNESIQTKRGSFDQAVKMVRVNPNNVPGYVLPAFQVADVDSTDASVVTTQINNWAVDEYSGTATAYGVGETRLYKVTGATYNDIINNTPTTPVWPHAIASSLYNSGDNPDCVNAWVNIGGTQVYCLLYAYNRAAGVGKIGRFDIVNNSDWGAGNSADDAYSLSTNAISDSGGNFTVPRPMVVGTNKILYTASGYFIDSLDLTVSSATVTTNALDIDRSYEIQSMAFYKGTLVVAAYLKNASTSRRGKTAIFFWDTFSPSFSDPIFIDDDTCGALFQDDDDLYLFTANGVYGNLRQWDGQGFSILTQVAQVIPAHGAVDRFRGGFTWGDTQGNVYYYGRAADSDKRSLWTVANMDTTISCVKRLAPTNDLLHFTGANGATEFIKVFNTTYDSGVYSFPVIDLPHRSTITRVEVQFLTLATGAAASIRYLPNFSGSYTTLGSISFASDGAVTRKVFTQRISNISAIAFDLSWTGTSSTNQVAVERIIVTYMTPQTKQSS